MFDIFFYFFKYINDKYYFIKIYYKRYDILNN